MQIQITEWLIFWINTSIALITTFLVDFLLIWYAIRNRIDFPVDKKDEKQIRKFYGFSLGIIPGILVFIYLHIGYLLALDGRNEQSIMIVVFTFLIIITSYTGAKLASLTTKQNVQVDLNLIDDTDAK